MNDQKIDAETKGLKRRPPSPAPDDKPKIVTNDGSLSFVGGAACINGVPIQTNIGNQEPEDEPAKPAPTRRKLDPELKAMDEVCEILEGVDEDAQRRILTWINYRFGPAKDPTSF